MTVLPSIEGFSASDPAPKQALEIAFGQGASTAPAGSRHLVICGPKLSSGTFQANQLKEVGSEAECADGLGQGSACYIAATTAMRVNKRGRVYVLPYSETAGVAADGYFEISGTATKAGAVKFNIHGEDYTVGFVKDDTGEDIGDLIESVIATNSHLPVSASNSSGTVTMTMKWKGASGGDGTSSSCGIKIEVTPGCGITVEASGEGIGLGAGTPGSDGATTEAQLITAALATIDNVRKYHVVITANDANSLAALKTHIDNKSAPLVGHRSRGFFATTESLASAVTKGTTLNDVRVSGLLAYKCPQGPALLAAQFAALVQKVTADDTLGADLVGYRDTTSWIVKAPYDTSDYFDYQDFNDAINGGLTPVGQSETGTFLVDHTTTRSKNEAGSADDKRALHGEKVSVCDELGDIVMTRYANTFQGFSLADDERLEDGSVDPNQRKFPKRLTPSRLKKWLQDQVEQFASLGAAGKLDNIDANLDAIECVVDPSNPSTILARIPVQVVQLARKFGARIDEVSAG